MKKTLQHSIIILILIFTHAVVSAQDKLVISEFMALNNSVIQDEDGDYSDWIEIYNADMAEINLGGWYLTDEDDNYSKWAFPDLAIDTGEYLVVFASGKDRKLEKDKLHTNFKLSSSGEFLGLGKPDGSQYVSLFVPAYPEQYPDISYGLDSVSYTYFSSPTPGSENIRSTYITAPEFSRDHGYYYGPFDLQLFSDQKDADIYYTTDASTPDSINGSKYSESINILTTTVIRAVACIKGTGCGLTKTQTYIFPEDVIHQSNDQPGYPETWIDPRREIEIPGNYGMKTEFVDRSEVSNVIIQSLESLPVISIVSDIGNFFSRSTHPDSGGIYMYNGEPDGPTRDMKYHLGRGWERMGSVEYFNSDTKDGLIDFQANCCLKIHGGATRTRMKTEKHSFKVGFKPEYGPSKLNQQLFGKNSPDQYDWFILRGGFDRRLGQQIRDPWAKSTMREMGQYAARSKFVHVYLNGLYWGMYNLCEQMDENCMRDNLGGSADDYDIIKDYYEIEAGDTLNFDKLVAMADDHIENQENYQKLLGNNPDGAPNPSFEKMVNPENLVDYIMMNMYAGTGDWDYHNWLAARRRTDSEGFHFLVWDAEGVFRNVNNVSWIVDKGEEKRPTGIFSDLVKNDRFKDLFVSHVNRHFFEGGALTPDPGLERYEIWLNDIDTALIADQARWVYDTIDIWNEHYHSFIYSYFPPRSETVFNQFITKELYPFVEPPVFNTEINIIPEDFLLYMSSPSGGEIRYTLDGTDPGHFKLTDNKSINIYNNQPIPITADTLLVSARVRKDTLWSKLVSKEFLIGINSGSITCKSIPGDGYFYNFPNPVNKHTCIMFSLSKPAHVCLKIYSLQGVLVAILENQMRPAGQHSVWWNSGSLPPGTYICVLEDLSTAKRYRIMMMKE
ncbi:MAG: CotH kinase family protein [Bacteroidales bacterium]|nr:CotH kinase family protein [Bacteroidales bacterium]